jgi:5'-deoxynucleotidase YfbR-like HD superfamily hydrolase
MTLERLKFDRQAARVRRCHTKPYIEPYSIGSHTHNVVSLLALAWRDQFGELPRAELLLAAQAHDKAELVTGDIPSPVKDLLGEACQEVDTKVERFLFGHLDLTDTETEYLMAADRFELWLWCWDEIRLGNEGVRDWAEGYSNKWREEPLPSPFNQWFIELQATGGLGQYTAEEVMIIGGLK